MTCIYFNKFIDDFSLVYLLTNCIFFDKFYDNLHFDHCFGLSVVNKKMFAKRGTLDIMRVSMYTSNNNRKWTIWLKDLGNIYKSG